MNALGRRRHSVRGGPLPAGRQSEPEDRATGLVWLRPDPAAMGVDNRAADRKSQPHATGLGRVEGLEKMPKIRRIEPWAGIPHFDKKLVLIVPAGIPAQRCEPWQVAAGGAGAWATQPGAGAVARAPRSIIASFAGLIFSKIGDHGEYVACPRRLLKSIPRDPRFPRLCLDCGCPREINHKWGAIR